MTTQEAGKPKSRGAVAELAVSSTRARSLGALLFALAVLVAAPAARAICNPPVCLDVVVPVPPTLSVPDSTVRILLPEGYDSTNERYPVLYLLHGAGDTYTAWTDLTDVEEFSRQFPLIIVMPDGGRDANAGFYSDWVDGSRQWETFHIKVLRRYIERNFRTLSGRRHRAVAGLSMGGFGAISYAARHRDLFQAAASFSGAVDSLYPSPETNVLFVGGIVGAGIWGDPAVALDTWRAHNPVDLAPRLRNTAVFLATGDGTRGGPAGDIDNAGAYGIEQVCHTMTLNLASALDAAGIPYTSDFYDGGYHGWPYWERALHWSLPQIMEIIGGRSAPCPQGLGSLGSRLSGGSSCALPALARRPLPNR